jgi:glycosyltransferase involved in cell wall biosynthesis
VRVLLLTSSYPRWDGDVSGLFLRDLADTLAASGLEVSVIAPHDAGAARKEQLGAVPVQRFRYAPSSLEALAYSVGMRAAARSRLRRLLVPPFMVSYLVTSLRATRRLRPDVVHAHWWFPGGLVGVLVGRLTGVPVVLTMHGSDVEMTGKLLRPLARWVLRRCALVATVSSALRDAAVERFDLEPRRCVVLHMPLVMPERPEGQAPTAPPLRLVAVGRLAPEKGFDVLVAALDGLDADLEVFGAGTEALTGGRITGHGPRPRAEIAAALVRAHALVVPSRHEGFGLAALESLSMGTPVVASRVGGLVETVVDGVDGILVVPDDPVALAGALRQLPLPAPTSAATERHRPAEVAAQHVLAYEQAVSEPRP